MASSAKSVLKSELCFRLFAFGSCGRPLWAVRPLAASAPLAAFEALEGRGGSSASSPLSASSRFDKYLSTSFSKASQIPGSLSASFGQGRACSSGSQVQSSLSFRQLALRSSRLRARQGTEGRASTRCCAARAGEVRLLASGTTQRKMQHLAGRAICVRPNPSIERTRPGKPGRASHVKR